ncbi:DHA2 family efflux MFS transporter permease subunit [Kyrpidia tusciae]|uniref:Drug resistance transporter, EmrB/QacA subfamily n=1 Tax=Kyrpidia tusciae (strain DSM 2912 / NBRC 15312 / T2) TaxID=562970 RepID=D5WS07_KYRT2|nr:DHA2 family efflux MFS transporter permease subunit [Kyrpidia tusciae]ADG06959.1 drug resistance transporter, EmrB/QacA subfamily [Kyrpidia tusciae DSM 2912]
MQKWLVLVVVVLGLSLDLLDMTIVEVAIPDIMNQFGADIHLVQYVVTAYMMTIGLVEPVTAYLAETRGMKKMYIVSLIVFILGSALCAESWSIESLIAFRVVQAVGGGMIMPLSLSIVQKVFAKEELPLAMGLMGIPLLIAPAVGPVLGGYLVEHVSWEWIFWLNIPVGIPAVIAAWVVLTEFETMHRKLDTPGFILSGIGFSSLLLAISNGPDEGWGSASIVGLFFLSVSCLTLFVWVEATVSEPLLDLRLFRHRIYTSATVVTFFLMMSLFGSLYLVPLFLQQLRNMGPVDTGLALIPEVLGAALLVPISALLLPRVGATWLTIAGVVVMTAGMMPLTSLEIGTDLQILKQHLAVVGCGLGLGIMPAVTLAYSTLPDALVNQGSAFLNLVRQIGSALGVSMLTTILQEKQPVYVTRYAETITLGSPAEQAWNQIGVSLQSLGHSAGEAQQLMMSLLVQSVEQAASVLAFHDAFFAAVVFGWLTIVPALFLYQNQRSKTKTSVGEALGGGQP